LLIDLNRSNGKKGLFSEATKKLPNAYKRDIIETYYLPYRTHIEHFMQKHIEEGTQIIHLSIHSFTPIWNGEERDCDVGFLYDSSRNPEKCFCSLWLNKLRSVNPSLTLRKNYPYKGTSDGFATYLRKRYAENSYVGIELEVNQKFYFEDAERWEYVSNDIISSLTQALKINCG
jgi:predicted N-formylglutamate amidohydrolase